MAIYVHDGTAWQAASEPGGLRPYVHNGTAWQPVTEVYVHNGTGWQLSYQYDATAPTASAPTATRVSAGTTMTVSYSSITDSESGIVYAAIERYYNEETVGNSSAAVRTTLYNNSASPVASISGGNYSDSIANSIRKNDVDNHTFTVYYRIVATDAAGNTRTTSWSTGVPTKPKGTFAAAATQTSTWETAGTAAWRTDTQNVISGYYDSTYATQTGYWFYGNAVQAMCDGYAPNSGTIYMQRDGADGLSGSNNIAPHGHTTRPTTASYLSAYEDVGPTLSGSDAAVFYSLPASWLTLFGNGTAHGVAAVDSGSYRSLKGINKNAYSGALTFVFT